MHPCGSNDMTAAEPQVSGHPASNRPGALPWLILSLVVLVFVAFFPGLGGGFVNWDDPKFVLENWIIKGLGPDNIRAMFTSYVNGNYGPLTLLSFAVDFHFFGSDPFFYHLHNLLLHAANTLLVFWLLQLFGARRLGSWCGAILFAIHPLRVESVTWITERKDVSYAFFFLLSLISYLYYRRNEKPKFYALSLFFCLLSLFTKGQAVTLPFLFLLCDWYKGVEFNRRTMKQLIPFFFLSFLFVFITIMGKFVTKDFNQHFTWTFRFLIASWGLIFYLVKTFVPFNLSPFYPFPATTAEALPLEFQAAPAVVFVLGVLLLLSARRDRSLAFGVGFFVIAVFPVLQLVPAGPVAAADRFTYLPSIGISYLLARLTELPAIASSLRRHAWTAILLGLLTTVFFVYLTRSTCLIWKDSISLWQRAVAYAPANHIPNSHLGTSYLEAGNATEAIPHFTRALEINPEYAEAFQNRGYSYMMTGADDLALADFERAIRLPQHNDRPFLHRGTLKHRQGDVRGAIEDYTKAIELNPALEAAYFNRAVARRQLGNLADALSDLERSRQLSPDSEETRSLFEITRQELASSSSSRIIAPRHE